jgi:hypothetical protein
MLIFIDGSGNYPRFIGDILIDHPEWKIGDPIPEGWTRVISTVPPQIDSPHQILEEATPAEIDGEMTQQWRIREMTEEEVFRLSPSNSAREKLLRLGFTPEEINAIAEGLSE